MLDQLQVLAVELVLLAVVSVASSHVEDSLEGHVQLLATSAEDQTTLLAIARLKP